MKTQLSEEDLIGLLNRYIENTATSEEVQLLIGWIKDSDDTTFFDIVSQSRWNRMAEEHPETGASQEALLHTEALRLLEKFESGRLHVRKNKVRLLKRWFGGVAAALLVLLGMACWKYFDGNKAPVLAVSEQEYIAGNGEIKRVCLADSTVITLNSGSRLYVAAGFNGHTREVRIDGEAFFQVARNPAKPFVVSAGEVEVKVLGTSFDVNSYSDDPDIAVTVSTGKVQVGIDECGMQMHLLPNEHISINKQTGNVYKKHVKENNYVKWIDGYLYFDKLPLQQVVKMINRKYNTQVVLRCTDCPTLISGMHDNKSIEAVVESVCFIAGLKYTTEGGRIIIYK